MAIIPLRAYNREIEGMIDNGQLDEAVAHCRHILATFPKHIASYRLLGKAHLEQQRISDATDIFQRVLSAIPDDFIANVGMSIIREDENNLDASIWHMELAYEAQPSNVAIQDELRRLYGRRDGIQPPKVRLTRGALARMYAKGGLYDQAIAELRAAISEDPNRPDLQQLIAQMFFQTSQRVESVETCVNILKKLPYCLAANQILAVSLPEAERSDASKNYRQIAISMDPYFAFASPDAISSDQVPENAVNIEKLEWKSGLQIGEAAAQPAWATSLGISLEKPAEEKLPDWLKGTEAPAPVEPGEKAQPSVSPFIWDTQEVEKIITDAPKPEEEIPDWMKDAGWKPATGEATQEPGEAKTESPSTAVPPEEDLAKADIPDWLRGIAPEGILEDELPGSQAKEKDVSIPWLEKQQPGPTDSIIQWLEEKKPETPEPPVVPEGTTLEATEEEVPDWLKDLDVPVPHSVQAEQPTEEAPAFTTETSELNEEPVISEPIETAEPEADRLDEVPVQIDKIEPIPTAVEPAPASEVSESAELSSEPTEELPDWLMELAGQGPEATVSVISGEEQVEELPAMNEEKPIAEAPVSPEEVPPSELPVTDKLVSPKEPPVAITEEPAEELAVSSEGLPSAEMPVISEEEPSVEVPITTEEMPATEVPSLAEEPPQIEQPIAAEGELTAEVPATPAEADALAWLEGGAAQQGAKEEELNTPPEALEGIPPEWVKLGAEASVEEVGAGLKPQPEEAPAVPADEIPEWIKGLGETSEVEEVTGELVSATSPEPEIPQAEGLPSWLRDLKQSEEEKEALVSSQEAVEPEALEPEALEPEALEWKEEELPEWLKEITETAPSEEAPATELTAAEEVPAPPSEPISEWTSEEVHIAGVGEEKLVEPPPEELSWVPEVETPSQPVPAVPVEAEVEPAAMVDDLLTKAVDSPAAAPPEQPVVPGIEPIEAELTQLEDARNLISQGLPTQAAEVYTSLIKQNHRLEEVIKDLQDALYRFPVDVNLWVTFGDAYFRTDELQEALNAYTKAEDLVR